MSERRRILILTLSFGSGHVAAAEALAEKFVCQLPKAEVRLVDALEHCRLPFQIFYVWTYWAMIRFAPALWNKFFAARLSRRDEQTAPVWALNWGFARVLSEIQRFQPDLIVACEVAAGELAVIARRKHLTEAKIISVITDFEAEPIWVKPEVAAFAVPSERVAEQLLEWGANAAKIKICGIPLKESFGVEHGERATRRKFNLDERPLVLLMGGGMGPTQMDAVAANLLKNGEHLQIVALPGRDARALRKLKKLKNTVSTSLRVLSWTAEVAALMQTAQILATKPGGVTLAEAAVSGLPLVLFDHIPGPEEINAERFAKAGAAVITRGTDETAQTILNLLGERQTLSIMAEHAKLLAQPEAAACIVQMAIAQKCDSTVSANEFAVVAKRLEQAV